MFGPVGDPSLGPERNSERPRRPLLVGSLAPAPHLRLVTAQSQEQLASKHFGLLQGVGEASGTPTRTPIDFVARGRCKIPPIASGNRTAPTTAAAKTKRAKRQCRSQQTPRARLSRPGNRCPERDAISIGQCEPTFNFQQATANHLSKHHQILWTSIGIGVQHQRKQVAQRFWKSR